MSNVGQQTERRALGDTAWDGSEPRQQARERISLLLYHRDGARLVSLEHGQSLVVGRGDESDVVFDDKNLSRRHARLTGAEGRVLVEDLDSTNGTWQAGRRIKQGELTPDAEVSLGGVIASVHVLNIDDAPRELLSHEAFVRHLDVERARARFFRRPMSVVLARPRVDDAPPLRRWLAGVQAHMRPIDTVARYGPNVVEVLLPEADTAAALAFARTIASSSEPRLACGVATFPDAADSGEELVEVAREAMLRARAEMAVVVAESGSTKSLAIGADDAPISVSAGMQQVFETAARLAQAAIPVLLQAETGAGKEVVARAIHARGPRRDNALVSVNCAAIPDQLLESTLFGHERGAFTGATQQHRGVFETANGGTVFLDEVGELPATAQAALLRVLEAKTIVRVGSTKEIAVDARVVAATHRDLSQMVEAGSFREDLLYRLNAMTVTIPPLRERRDDIPALVERFLVSANRSNGTNVTSVEPEAMEVLCQHAWPGNVRELRNVIERAVLITNGSAVRVDDLPLSLSNRSEPVEPAIATSQPSPEGQASLPPVKVPGLGELDFKSTMEQLEAEVLLRALRACGWNQTHAAKRLSMPLRTFVHKMKTHNLRRLQPRDD